MLHVSPVICIVAAMLMGSLRHVLLAASEADGLSLPQGPPLVILAWGSPTYGPDVVERYAEFAQAGYTHGAVGFADADQAAALLDAAEAAGVRLLPMLPWSKISGPEIAHQFSDHPALGGYFIADEPSAEDFPKLTQTVRDIRAVEKDPEKIYLVNLFPNYANNHQLGLEPHQAYVEYVHKFLTEVPVNLLSFDYYPINRFSLNPGWYENLDIIASSARMAKVPMWVFIATVGFNMFPEPSVGSLRLQSYTSLAYGATGIEHWFYWHYPGHRASAIDAEGQRTVTYDYLRQVNGELQARAGVFVGSTVRRVGYVGATIPPTLSAYKPRSGIKSATAGGNGAIAAHLDQGDLRFFMLVNQNYLESIPASVTWRQGMAMHQVDHAGQVLPIEGEKFETLIEPGDACILMWRVQAD